MSKEEFVFKMRDELCTPTVSTKWRCTHGHKWEAPIKVVGVSFGAGLEPIGISAEDFCLLCLYELCRERVGRIREDI